MADLATPEGFAVILTCAVVGISLYLLMSGKKKGGIVKSPIMRFPPKLMTADYGEVEIIGGERFNPKEYCLTVRGTDGSWTLRYEDGDIHPVDMFQNLVSSQPQYIEKKIKEHLTIPVSDYYEMKKKLEDKERETKKAKREKKVSEDQSFRQSDKLTDSVARIAGARIVPKEG